MSRTPASGFIWGVQGHPAAQAAYPASGQGLAQQFAYLNNLGATHYRIDVYPDSAGRVDPSFDGIVRTAADRDITLLPVLVARPDRNASESATYHTGYVMGYNFARHFRGRFSHVEAGNELDSQVLKCGVDSSSTPPKEHCEEGSLVTHYVDTLLSKTTLFLRGITDGLHQGSPGTRVVINAGWRHYGFFHALHRDSVTFEVYGYHWYSDMGDFGSEILSHLTDPNKEIWVTEANRKNAGDKYNEPEEQADWIARFARELTAMPRVKALFIYELYDERAFGDSVGESYYGLVGCGDQSCRGPKTLKPGFLAYREAIRGSVYAGRSQQTGELSNGTD